MAQVFFDNFCEGKKCEHFIEWEYTDMLPMGNRYHESTIECLSCTLVGQSYNVEKYPDTCPYLKEIKVWEEEQLALRTWNILKREHI